MKLKKNMPKMPKMPSLLGENALTLATMCGVVVGIILGASLKASASDWTEREVMYVSYIGDLFLSMLKCIIMPLIIPSLIASVGSLDLSLSGKVGGRAVAYYMITTVLAVVLGIILVTSIRPGVGGPEQEEGDVSTQKNVTTPDTLMDLLRNCFPPNIIQATIQQYRTSLVYPGPGITNDSNIIRNETDLDTWETKGDWSDNTNILGLVVFSIVTGIAIASCGEAGLPLLRFFESVSVVMMQVTTWIIYLAPVGVCFLIAGQIMEMQNMGEQFAKLGWYFATVLIGLGIHGLIVLPAIYALMTRTLPFKFIMNMMNALTTAFGTASSSATLPVTMDCLENKNHVDARVSKFVLPIGATINMDGTALYEAIAAIFIAQVYGAEMGFGSVIAISITATAASIGAAGIPQAGLVTMVMVLNTVGLPSESVSLILAVDWLLDRFRTAINVLGDSIGAGIVYHLSKNELPDLPTTDEQIDEKDHYGSNQTKMNGINNDAYADTPM